MNFALDVTGLVYSGSQIKLEVVDKVMGVKENPLFVHFETSTDWVALAPSFAGVFVAIAVAFITLKVQRNQIRSNISNFRHGWMVELRDCSSEYFQALFSMAIRIEGDSGYKNSVGRIEMHEKLVIIDSKLHMLLSRDDNDVREIIELDSLIVNELNNLEYGQNCEPVLEKIKTFKNLIRKELENAWEDIKKDVGLKQSAKAPSITP